MELNEQQRQIVESNAKKIVVLSCAGSGKTTVITKRIARLWGNGIEPEEILALTFSNKASREMKERIRKENPALGSKTNVRTFHSFGLDIIKRYSESFGFTDKINIAKGSEKNQLAREIFNKYKLKDKQSTWLLNYVRNTKSFERYLIDSQLEVYSQEYSQKLLENNLVDMEDMIWLPVRFLQENESVQKLECSRYKYIFVDEYQDTNEGQNQLLNLLCSDETNICLVGDDDQAIYEWRGAKPSYIIDKAKSGDYEVLKLETNYRSQDGIIKVANAVISHNKIRIKKKIRSGRPETIKPLYKRLPSQNEEAFYVAEKIKELVSGGKYNPSDIAVLVRRNEQIDVLKKVLQDNGIEYDSCQIDENAGYCRFMNVLQSISELSSIKNLGDAINFPNRIFDEFDFADAKQAYCDKYGQDSNFETMEWINQIYLSDIYFENCNEFRERYSIIVQMHEAVGWNPSKVAAFYAKYMEAKDYDTKYSEEYHFVLQVFDIAKNYEESFGLCSLAEFLEHLKSSIGAGETTDSVNLDAVNLITMHRSKGLEFKVVFIVGVQSGIFPQDYFIRSEYDLETERRLFYVAITRAKELLFFTSFKDPFGASGDSIYVTHGFMAEIPTISFSQNFSFEEILEEIPDKEILIPKKSVEEKLADTSEKIVGTVREEIQIAEKAAESEPEITEAGVPVETEVKPGIQDITEEQFDEFAEHMYALTKDVPIPDDKFIIMIGATDIKAKVIPALFKNADIRKYEMFDYEGAGFNISKYLNNSHCIGMILGPMAHRIKGIDANSLNSKLLNEQGYPFTVNLIERHITKQTLREAIAKIKWNYIKENKD